MRLAAIAKNIKASGVCGVHYVGPLHEVWIMTAHGIYRLNGYPKPIDRDETAMMFGIGPKTKDVVVTVPEITKRGRKQKKKTTEAHNENKTAN